MDLPLSSFMFLHLCWQQKVLIWWVAGDGFLCVTEIACIFHKGYFDYRGAFQTVLDLYCCVTH